MMADKNACFYPMAADKIGYFYPVAADKNTTNGALYILKSAICRLLRFS
ncbi:MAG: hypothetical protein NC102_08510 [Clostridium sp.]|nr:hypothetical protein [Clostridium sp.]